MKISLYFVRETADAVLYQNKNGKQTWIPRSVIIKRLKYPANGEFDYPIHELTLEDYWAQWKDL